MAQSLANFHFNNFNHVGEQRLVEDLVTESISIYGLEVGYLAKTFQEGGFDQLYNEESLPEFTNVTDIVMYLKSADGFEGEGDFLSKFGLEIRDSMVLCVARRHFEESVEQQQSIFRPREGDLIFLPLNEKMFEIKFVEHEPTFYQMGALQFYELRCDLYEYSSGRFNTGVEIIDQIETSHSLDVNIGIQLLLETGSNLLNEDGGRMLQEAADRSGDNFNFMVHEDGQYLLLEDGSKVLFETQPDQTDFDDIVDAENVFFETQADGVIDFSEADPFSEGGRF